MSIDFDIERLRATFLEEARELIASFEAALLVLEEAPGDTERVHQLFRDAHSLKGGAATVGWTDLVSLLHELESLLEHWRNGMLVPGRAHFDALLQAADVIRGAVSANGAVIDMTVCVAVRQQLAALAGASQSTAAVQAGSTASSSSRRYSIKFVPHQGACSTGGDPLLVIREVVELSSVYEVRLDASNVPLLEQMDVDASYFGWMIDMAPQADVTRARIEEAFSFIDADVTVSEYEETPTAAADPDTEARAQASETASVAGATQAAADSTLRVSAEKVDALVDLVGELVISHSVMREIVRRGGAAMAPLLESVVKTERHLRDLQERVMAVRMVPVSALFARIPRLVRELAGRLGKQVRIVVDGGDTELDKVLVEQLVDPCLHLVRNALDHGLESPDRRAEAGKPATGTLRLGAFARGGSVYLEVGDDGRGLQRDRIIAVARARGMTVSDNATDAEVFALIAAPGFSTAEQITDLSGRGVGLDVVRRNIENLGGELTIDSVPGAGTTFRLRLPLTLTIMDGLQIRAGGETCVMPIGDVAFSMMLDSNRVRSLAGMGEVVDLDNETLPLLSLSSLIRRGTPAIGNLAVVVQAGSIRYALRVESLLGQAQVVVKSIETHFRRIPGMIGATILGDGKVALILDGQGLASVAGLRLTRNEHAAPAAGSYSA